MLNNANKMATVEDGFDVVSLDEVGETPSSSKSSMEVMTDTVVAGVKQVGTVAHQAATYLAFYGAICCVAIIDKCGNDDVKKKITSSKK